MEQEPCVRLRPFVAYYWMLRFGDVDYPVKTTPPDGGADLIFDMGYSSEPLIFGQYAGFFRVPSPREQHIFGIRLKPGAAHALFGIPAAELYDAAVPLSLLLQPADRNDFDHIACGRGMTNPQLLPDTVAAIEPRLLKLCDGACGLSYKLQPIYRAVDNLRGEYDVSALMARLSLSARQIERQFNTVYGLTPKSFMRILRFQNVLSYRNKYDAAAWADISNSFGFSDQSHLCREFRVFTGMSPQAYFSLHLVK